MAITCFDMPNINNEVNHTSIWDPHSPDDSKSRQYDELNSQDKGNDFQNISSFDNNLYNLSSCWNPSFINEDNSGSSNDKILFQDTFLNESELNNSNQNNSIFLEPSNGWNSWNNIYNWIDKHDKDLPSATDSPAVPDQGSNCSEEHSDSMRSDSLTTSPLHHNSPIHLMWSTNFDESHGSNINTKNGESYKNKEFSDILIKMGNLQMDENLSSNNWQDSLNDLSNNQQHVNLSQSSNISNNIWQNFEPSLREDKFSYSINEYNDINKDINNIWRINSTFNNFTKTPALNQIQNKQPNFNSMEKVKEVYVKNEDKSQDRNFNQQNNKQQWNNDKNWNTIYSQYQIEPKESYEGSKHYSRHGNHTSTKPILPNNQIGATYSMYQNSKRTKSPSLIYTSKKIHQQPGNNRIPLSRPMPNAQLSYAYSPNFMRDGKLNYDEEELHMYHKTLQMHQAAYDQIYDLLLRNNGSIIENNIHVDPYRHPPPECPRPPYPIITQQKNTDNGRMYTPPNIIPSVINIPQQINNFKRENNIVNLKIEECSAQYRQLENERKKTEAELARHNLGKKISSSNTIQIPRLPPAPLKVDRLIVDYFREHARVTTLLSKMIQLRGQPMPPIIHDVMAEFLDAIKNLQKMRLQERENILSHLRGEVGSYNERIESMNLVRSLMDVIRTTQKARAANWCCLIWTLGPIDNDQQTQIERIINANFQMDPPEIKFRPV
uniref:Meiosis-specific coiled-coil domain-containing protein MEIOC-like n=1 Tax=Parastrongyloides trichosuri TaxID=131310 RepID=A0A0N4ZVL0_PARTI